MVPSPVTQFTLLPSDLIRAIARNSTDPENWDLAIDAQALWVLLQAHVKISNEAISHEYEIIKSQKRADLPSLAIGNTFRR